MKKGISPLIATVVLVAIVIGVATLVGPEILSFVEDETKEVTNRSLKKIDCRRANIYIEDVICENITVLKQEGNETVEDWYLELRLKVRNTGFQDLTDFRLEYFRNDTWREYEFYGSSAVLPAESSRIFTVNKTFDKETYDYLINNITDGRFISGTCPGTASRDIKGEEFSCE